MAGGRPKIPIDYALVEKLAEIQCTQTEIASVLGVSVKTLQRDDEFCRLYKKGLDDGRACLRRRQWAAANKGNTTMLIWLGKQYLGQKDKASQEVEGGLEIKVVLPPEFTDGSTDG